MKRNTIAVGLFTLFACAASFGQGFGPSSAASTSTATTVTNVAGIISQLNYGPNGSIDGFLIGTNVLLNLHIAPCSTTISLGVVGNNVTYSGTARTASSGFESVFVSSLTNNTTGATYTAPTTTSTSYGPTSGTVTQINYGGDGSINGFLFSAIGASSSIFVITGSHSSSTLSSLLTVGATVAVTGTSRSSVNTCSSSAALQTVAASSLTIGGQTIVISGAGHDGAGAPGGPGGRGGIGH